MRTWSGGGDTFWTDRVGEWRTYCMDISDGCHSLHDSVVVTMATSSGSKVMARS
jgi:hypothetical protein